ncbi:hypothetical protein F2Q70_00045709 [Brassica cretica]|uniref:Myb-like domain-containing protein n=1 Tax=Brassica cretica TaxID=69181 RepID=A0A8S9KKM7_BRACR|nr:hypothetical protein F2Q70_00045709 [Brassica cretica]
MGKGRAPCCDKTKVKRGPWSPEEDLKLISFIQKFGHENWRSLPKQSGMLLLYNEIKNVWHTHLKKRLVKSSASPDEPASPCSSDKTQAEDCLNIKTTHDSTTSASSGGSNNSNQEDDPNMSLMFEYSQFNDIIEEVILTALNDCLDYYLELPSIVAEGISIPKEKMEQK